jgi:hypothetical protein
MQKGKERSKSNVDQSANRKEKRKGIRKRNKRKEGRGR